MAEMLNTNNFEEKVQEGIVVVDFFAEWCGPCKMLAPIFEQLSDEMKETVTFAKVDIDQNLEIARKFMVSSVPTMMIFKDGKHVDTMVGFMPKDAIKAKVQAHI